MSRKHKKSHEPGCICHNCLVKVVKDMAIVLQKHDEALKFITKRLISIEEEKVDAK